MGSERRTEELLERLTEAIHAAEKSDGSEVVMPIAAARRLLVEARDAVSFRRRVKDAYAMVRAGEIRPAEGFSRITLWRARRGRSTRRDHNAAANRYLFLTRQLRNASGVVIDPPGAERSGSAVRGPLTGVEGRLRALSLVAVEFGFDSERGAWDSLDGFRRRLRSGKVIGDHLPSDFELPQKPF